jgi:hypothetical protein
VLDVNDKHLSLVGRRDLYSHHRHPEGRRDLYSGMRITHPFSNSYSETQNARSLLCRDDIGWEKIIQSSFNSNTIDKINHIVIGRLEASGILELV